MSFWVYGEGLLNDEVKGGRRFFGSGNGQGGFSNVLEAFRIRIQVLTPMNAIVCFGEYELWPIGKQTKIARP